MSAPTAAEIAIVLDIIVRNTLMPRSRWFSSTASISPTAMPTGNRVHGEEGRRERARFGTLAM